MAKRDAEDRALLKRGKNGALRARIPATGSTIPGGSSIHRSDRHKLNKAFKDGLPIIVRESDGVAIRPASIFEVCDSFKDSLGRITCSDVRNEDGVTWGAVCVVRRERPVTRHTFNPTPRLVKTKRQRHK